MFYWRCPECGGFSEMARVCTKCIKRKEACTAATEQASSALNATKICINYTTKEAECQYDAS